MVKLLFIKISHGVRNWIYCIFRNFLICLHVQAPSEILPLEIYFNQLYSIIACNVFQMPIPLLKLVPAPAKRKDIKKAITTEWQKKSVKSCGLKFIKDPVKTSNKSRSSGNISEQRFFKWMSFLCKATYFFFGW